MKNILDFPIITEGQGMAGEKPNILFITAERMMLDGEGLVKKETGEPADEKEIPNPYGRRFY